jgi:NTP pyrophosphatase (non-canonical NTP hydrolase)
VTAAVMHRVSLAIEALEQIRKQSREACDPRRTGDVSAQIAMTAIRAQSQLEVALREMVQAIRGEDEEEAAE